MTKKKRGRGAEQGSRRIEAGGGIVEEREATEREWSDSDSNGGRSEKSVDNSG